MEHDWVGAEEWVSGAMLKEQQEKQQTEYRMANDHGILYLVGETRDGEWLQTMDQLPPKYQNNP